MGISSAVFQTVRPNIESEEVRLLLNVEASPRHRQTVFTEHEYKTHLEPVLSNVVFREFQAFLALARPELVVLASIDEQKYVRVHSMRRRHHSKDDVHGALALSLCMGDYELASVTGTQKPDKQSLNYFLNHLREEYTGDGYEFAFVGLTRNGFKKSGRDALLTEALYTFVCGRDAA